MNIGIFGGAFDPFHAEHKFLIECAHEELNLDKVVVVPSFLPPHKNCVISSYEARAEMVKAGTLGLDYVVIDDIELQRGTVNPTSVTLPILKQKYPCDNFYFLMGGDSVINFHSWIEPEKIAAVAKLAVLPRYGCGGMDKAVEFLRNDMGADITVLSKMGNRVSSSCIKATVELGFKPEEVSDEVLKTINKHSLYSRFSDLIRRYKSDVTEEIFKHCASTVMYGQSFTGLLKLRFEDVFLSCLLHDCAKNIHTDIEGVPSAVTHQYTGAERARVVYGITDDSILDAIRFHTSGKPNMSVLGKLVYCADMLEPNRCFPDVERLRTLISEDFELGFRECINHSYEYLISGKKSVYPLTKDCAEYYNMINKTEEK